MRVSYLAAEASTLRGWDVVCAEDEGNELSDQTSSAAQSDSLSSEWDSQESCAYVDNVHLWLLEKKADMFAVNSIKEGMISISVEGRKARFQNVETTVYEGVEVEFEGLPRIPEERVTRKSTENVDKSYAKRVNVNFTRADGMFLGTIEFYWKSAERQNISPEYVAKKIIEYLL